MKNLITTLVLTLASTVALAHPGGSNLKCKSAVKSGSKQVVEFTVARSNATGWYAPTYTLTIDGKKFEFATEDEMNNYGETFHNSPLGVITVTAENYRDMKTPNVGGFSVVAFPSTVKAYDIDGKLVKWNFEAEKDQCNDRNGKATFQGIFKGSLRSNGQEVPVDAQVMDCELEYNSGMAC